MSLTARLWLSTFFLVFLVALSGCGSGNQLANPAQEGFTNANFNGTFAFSVTGTNGGGFFGFAGNLIANGAGQITGGTVDINSPGLAQQTLTTPATLTGTYTVRTDGRTIANITTNVGVNFTLDFVLVSSSNGLVIRFDNNASASGSIDLQNPAAQSLTALAGPFAFNLSGIDQNGATDSTAGTFTFNTSGAVTTGIQDINDAGTVTSPTIGAGTVAAPVNGRGTITLNTSNGVFGFAYYPIDANHIRLVSTDSIPVFAGDAFRQPGTFTTSTAFAAGASSFTVAGASSASPIVEGGVLSADGNGNIIAGSTEDVNLNGALNQNVAVTGTYTMAPSGRGTLTLNGSQNFSIYPTMTGGVLMLELDFGTITTGTALAQQGTNFTNSTITGTYGMNFTGVNLNIASEVDAIAEFTADGNGNITGSLDFNQAGATSGNLALTGTYATAANGRGTATLNTSQTGTLSVVYYVVNSSKVLFIEADGAQPSVGLFETQTQ